MNRDDADTLVTAFLQMRFDAGLRVEDARLVGLPDAPVLLVGFRDDRRPGISFGAWWDFATYEVYLDQPDEMEWLASHAKIYIEELFHAGPELARRPRDAAGVVWCGMNSVATSLPPERTT